MKIIKLSILLIALGVFTQTNAQDDAKKEKKKQFSKIDADSNGSVSADEMTTFYKGKENKKGDAIDGAKIFKRKDADID